MPRVLGDVLDDGPAARAFGLGAVTGLRSMAAPATLSRAAAAGRLGLEGTPFEPLGSARVAQVLTALEVGELIGDKLPFTPSRTSPLPVLGRAALGALVGAALCVSEGRRASVGGALGGCGAVAAAYAGERLRVRVGELLGVPDPAVALLEDAVVLFGVSRLLP